MKTLFASALLVVSSTALADRETTLGEGSFLIHFSRPTASCATEHNMTKTVVNGDVLALAFEFGAEVRCEGTCPQSCQDGPDTGTAFVRSFGTTVVEIRNGGSIQTVERLK